MFFASVVVQNLVLGTQILMVAVSLYLVFSASKIFHLAIGSIGVAAAYVLFLGLSSDWGLPLAVGAALGTAIVLGLISARLLEVFAVQEANLLGLLVSFALGVIIESIISITFGTSGKSLQEGILTTVSLGGVTIDLPGLITIGLGLALAGIAWLVINFTKIGRLLRGLSENTPLTTSLGINNQVVRYSTYTIAAVVSAVVIIMSGWHTALTPLMGFNLIIAAFIVLLMGGVRDLRGTIISAYIIAIIPGIIIGYVGGISENWRLVFVFGIAAVVLAIRPDGILANKTRES